MNAEKTGLLIYNARINRKLTQKELAALVGVTDKAISKWEKGRGCPDITLLPNLSKALEIDIQSILRGELLCTNSKGGNMRKLKIYRCSDCGNLVTSTKDLELNCCGKRLEKLVERAADKAEKEFIPEIAEFDGQYTVKFNHPMTKENYISNIITAQFDRITVVSLFAEQEAQITLPQINHVKMYVVTNKNDLILL